MRLKKIVLVILMIILVGLLPIYLIATELEAQITALQVANALSRRFGLTVRDNFNYGFLSRGNSHLLSTTLYAGNTYSLVAGGCSAARDVDLFVYDQNFNFIKKDSDSSQKAVVLLQPKWTGTFYIKITMYDCTYQGAHWCLVYAYN